MTRDELAKTIYSTSTIKGTFRLRSGIISNEYFDKYLFEADPVILEEIVKAILPLIPNDIDYLAGLEMGGIPIATMVSHFSRIPCLFIRKKSKEYGTCKYAEGFDFNQKRVVIIEDVVTKAGAIIDAATMLRRDGALITEAICVIDREDEGREILKKIGIELKEVYRKHDFDNYG